MKKIRIVLLTTSLAFALLMADCGKHEASSSNAPSEAATATPPAIGLAQAAKLTNLNQPTSYSLDVVSGVTVPLIKGSIGVPVGTSIISVGGWAVDKINNAPAKGVVIVLNDKPISIAAYGNARPDVATALGNAAFTNVGFNGTLDANLLRPGVNQLTLWIVSSTGGGYYVSKNYPIEMTQRSHRAKP